MLAVANGAHLLSPEWLSASREAGRWLPEADFAVEVRRTSFPQNRSKSELTMSDAVEARGSEHSRAAVFAPELVTGFLSSAHGGVCARPPLEHPQLHAGREAEAEFRPHLNMQCQFLDAAERARQAREQKKPLRPLDTPQSREVYVHGPVAPMAGASKPDLDRLVNALGGKVRQPRCRESA